MQARRALVLSHVAALSLAALAAATSSACSKDDSGGPSSPATDAGDEGGDASTVYGEGGLPESGPPACVCKPDYCGCGPCTPEDIVCSTEPPACPLTCARSCPQLAMAECKCLANRCIRVNNDAGAATSCYSDLDCPPAQCCAKGTAMRGVCTKGVGGCQ